MTSTLPVDDLVSLADAEDERAFAAQAVEFVDAHFPRRAPQSVSWGSGPEKLTLFHETSNAEERAEADAALAWQRRRFQAGFGWICGPTAHGGRGLPVRFDRLYRLIESEFDVPDMSPLRIGIGTVGPAIVALGTPDLIEEYARAIQTGDVIACQLFSEPAAGSDLAGVRTRGVRDGGGWRLDGQKVWTSNAQFADVGMALVRTDPGVEKHRGLTMFLVPMASSGIEVRPLRQMTGGASFTEVFLDGVYVPDRLRLGDSGDGWTVATTALAGERRSTGDRSHELTARAVELLRELATRTERFDDPLVRQHWATIYSALRIARFQQLRVQSMPDGALSGAERAIDKLLVSSNLRTLGEVASEILGPAFVADTGAWGTFAWNKWMMGALGYRIAGGTEEILKTMLAERVLGLPREPG
jgi:alkylation response protein AidB-like acyl-CoA dehydrogenase